MISADTIRKNLIPLDGKDYAGYQSLKGQYDYEAFSLIIEQIPKDPYAPPHTGIYRIRAGFDRMGITSKFFETMIQKIALRDFFARRFYGASLKIAPKRRGTGFSGIITIDQPGQTILDRSSIIVDNGYIEVRCFIGLPGTGRKINAKLADHMLFKEIPDIVGASILKESIDFAALKRHIHTAAQAEFLRNQLEACGLVAFIADGAVLPRESGTSDRPLTENSVVPFKSPKSLKIELNLINGERVSGMGIFKGVTLIVGGGYHGKSTLLQTIEQGIYNHISGDGRERCVSLTQSVKVRAYSGRYVEQTDISPFIRDLPFHKDTVAFSSENASGSTSQAAAIVEAIEAGAGVLLMDEDTCATNFMIRDRKMQQLVHKADEPITAFIDTVRQIYEENHISTVLVLGGVGDYFEVADRIVQMQSYLPVDVSKKAKQIASASLERRHRESAYYPITPQIRVPKKASIDPISEYGKKRLYATDPHQLHIGKTIVDLTDLEQLNELSQTKAIGYAMIYARTYMDGRRSLKDVVDQVLADIDAYGLDRLSNRISGHFAQFRAVELSFALNRLRSFKVFLKGSKRTTS